jgi:hypothetical protein
MLHRPLQVLDGIGIDAIEQNQAKEIYSGKLTEVTTHSVLEEVYSLKNNQFT